MSRHVCFSPPGMVREKSWEVGEKRNTADAREVCEQKVKGEKGDLQL